MSDSIVGELHQASQFLCDDGYNKHENPIRAIDNAAAEITRLRACIEQFQHDKAAMAIKLMRLRELVEAKDEALQVFADPVHWGQGQETNPKTGQTIKRWWWVGTGPPWDQIPTEVSKAAIDKE